LKLTLLRIYKGGSFRCVFTGRFNENSIQNALYCEGISNIIEEPIHERHIGFFRNEYRIEKGEINLVRKFINNNYPKLDNCAFAAECLSKLHALEEKFKIPFLFFILESFFPSIRQETTHRLTHIITKILGEKFAFVSKIKHLYEIRCEIVHGHFKAGEKQLKKLGYKTIKEARLFLEDLTRRIWKILLNENLLNNKKIEEKYF